MQNYEIILKKLETQYFFYFYIMKSSIKKYIIITAGGFGKRMGSSVAKQFLELGGKAILHITLERFAKSVPDSEIYLVLPSQYKQYWKDYCVERGLSIRHTIVEGGITRFHSVQNAVRKIGEGGLVAVHDGVRPFVQADVIRALFDKAEQVLAQGTAAGVVPVMPAVESMREIEDGHTRAVDRSRYLFVQTPQIFCSSCLKKAYSQAYNPLFTDDASVVESAGMKVEVSQGSRYNIKITTPEDMPMGECLLNYF